MAIRPQPTRDDIERLARELGVTFTSHRDSCDLDKQEPLRLEGTYRNNQAGINAALSSLVRLQNNLHTIPLVSLGNPRRGRGRAGAFLLCFLGMLIAYTVGTFYPETRGITGPLTILFVVLMMLSACTLVFGRTQQ